MRRDGAFRALLVLLAITVSAAVVPPPENISVRCRNETVSVSWDYSREQPGTRFRVSLIGNDGKLNEIETSSHHYDLTDFVWESQEHCLDFFYVNVTALHGGSQSKIMQSYSFSFHCLKSVDTKCSLDFPPVDADVDEDEATLSFVNPVHYYKKVEQTMQTALPKFTFTVLSVGNWTIPLGDVKAYCLATDRICKAKVHLHKDMKPCFKLKEGYLFDSLGIGSVMFSDTKEICATYSNENQEVILAVILTVVMLFSIILGVIIICRVKAWTMTIHDKLPDSLVTKHQGSSSRYDAVANECISKVSDVMDKSLQSGTTEGSDHSQSDEYLKRHGMTFYSDERLSERSSQTDSGSADCSEKTDCLSVESEEEKAASPYDCPHVHMVDMGDGDMVTGYGGN